MKSKHCDTVKGKTDLSEIFIEAESLSHKGGWTVETQSMETIGSAYLMAHGMGAPVEDACGDFFVAKAAHYNVFVRTRDWTKQWGVKVSAGQFKILIDGGDFGAVLGNENAEWSWQFCGRIFLSEGKHAVKLHDLTGFNGRCDAIYLTDSNVVPPNGKDEIEAMRKRLNYLQTEDFEKSFDLIVAGGGIAGICTALSAIWSGVDTLLICDRGVLGGCNSSEVRVCLGGKSNLSPFDKIGDVVRMIAPVMTTPAVYKEEYFEDHRKLAAFEAIDETCAYGHGKHLVRMNESVTDVKMRGRSIVSVITTNTITGRKTRYRAKLFSDCTGDAVLARKAGCAVMYGRDAKRVFGESLAPEEHQNLVMGHSVRWYAEKTGAASEFPDIDWGMRFDDETCLDVMNGDWEQETGFDRNTATETEYIRDYGLRAIYSNWSYQKNHYKHREKYADCSLKWVSPIGGKREGFRVVGDYIATQNDIENFAEFSDSTSSATWSIDMHFPNTKNRETFGEAFRSFAYHRGIRKPYRLPYRCLYAKDADNLFLGGRIVSASHIALSVLRVMRTLGQFGEVVGLAAQICKKYDCLPRQVYGEHLEELIGLLHRGVKIGDAFECDVGKEECYHFKEFGWFFFDPDHSEAKRPLPEEALKCIRDIGLEHKYPLYKK